MIITSSQSYITPIRSACLKSTYLTGYNHYYFIRPLQNTKGQQIGSYSWPIGYLINESSKHVPNNEKRQNASDQNIKNLQLTRYISFKQTGYFEIKI